MALFAAYAEQANETKSIESEKQSWLENSSFNVDLKTTETPKSFPSINTEPEKQRFKKKRKKHKHKKGEKVSEDVEKTEEKLENNDLFSLDENRTKEFLSVPTIARPSAPIYHVKFYIRSISRYRKQKFKRYFKRKKERDPEASNSEGEQVITKTNLESCEIPKADDNCAAFKQEEELSKTTASFNRSLAENPHDVKLWLKYVEFQDTIYQFEKSFRKGSIAKGLRVTAERKLAILDKAIKHIPDCEELLRERLNVCVSTYPADELQNQLKGLVEKDQGNIILWQGYIEATQCSMSHCNAPAVLELYIKCLSSLHKLRRTAFQEKPIREESILHMLYKCGLFLKQAGLFEQLWKLLQMYLELNLSPMDSKKFNLDSGFDEKQLIELEDVIFNSQLPLHELWLRTEKLRESCHWLPYKGMECEDPQRLVFNEDVAELVQPITVPENMFKLTATILILLKIPLLPCRHVMMSDLGLDYVPWALDGIESLLPAFLNFYHLDLSNKNFSCDSRLSVGPQYLKVMPGQEEYLEFLLNVMKNCFECLNGKHKIAIMIWWFRFQRLLLILVREDRFKMNPNLKKKIKTNFKSVLKEDAHRNNMQFFCEYALIEKELNDIDSAVTVLTKTLSVTKDSTVTSKPNDSQIGICHMFRHLIELLLAKNNDIDKQKALIYLVNYATGKSFSVNPQVLTQGALNEAAIIFKHISLQLIQSDLQKIAPVDHFLPNFFTDWLICHGYFLYLTKGALVLGAFLEEALEALNDKSEDKTFQKEVIYEFYVAILYSYCKSNPGYYKLFNDTLYKAIEEYPNNVFFLMVLAKHQSSILGFGHEWWRPKSVLIKTGRALPIVFLVLIANQKLIELCESVMDTITGTKYKVDSNHKNKMLALFKEITRPEICTRRCGLVWRLYLQFVHTHFTNTMCRNVYYSAVEECPWLKALYIDAAIYIPAELAQIQDLIVEKQLRIHVTPEELDILRS